MVLLGFFALLLRKSTQAASRRRAEARFVSYSVDEPQSNAVVTDLETHASFAPRQRG